MAICKRRFLTLACAAVLVASCSDNGSDPDAALDVDAVSDSGVDADGDPDTPDEPAQYDDGDGGTGGDDASDPGWDAGEPDGDAGPADDGYDEEDGEDGDDGDAGITDQGSDPGQDAGGDTPVEECISGDGICPEGCLANEDLDCPVLEVRILVNNFCQITVDPPVFGVPAGTGFYVKWINLAASDYPVDIIKVDAFNQVPLVLDLGPGESWFDDIREWCDIFTGTFYFKIDAYCEEYDLDIDCAAK
jgi:hypothetical protein